MVGGGGGGRFARDLGAGQNGGVDPEEHWSRSRAGMHREAIDHLRERSRAPGVAEGGAARNHYCMACHGVVPLDYDSRRPEQGPPQRCPHCGAELEGRVRAMFNWVEIDQVPASDLRALLPLGLVGLGLVALLVWLAVRWLA